MSDTTYLILAAIIVSSKSAYKHPLLTDCGPLALPLRARSGSWSARDSLKVDGSFCRETYIYLIYPCLITTTNYYLT
ncbi:hypothetical protein EY920_07370 [Citrobacter braakii]|nr:hypothetical protein EY920_07370 [Citrobacter braakii]